MLHPVESLLRTMSAAPCLRPSVFFISEVRRSMQNNSRGRPTHGVRGSVDPQTVSQDTLDRGMYYIHKNGTLTTEDSAECVTQCLQLAPRIPNLTIGFKRVEEQALRILWDSGLRHFRKLIQIRFLNIPETGVRSAWILCERVLELCPDILDVELCIDDRQYLPVARGYGGERMIAARNDEDRAPALSFFSPPPRGTTPPPPEFSMRESMRLGRIVRSEGASLKTLLIYSEFEIRAHHLSTLVDHESPPFQKVQRLQVGCKQTDVEAMEMLARALPLFPNLSEFLMYVETGDVRHFLTVAERGLVRCPKLRKIALFGMNNFSADEAAGIVSILAEIVLPSLDSFHGINLGDHADTLYLPEELRSEPNEGVLRYIREHPLGLCRELALKDGEANKEVAIRAVKQFGRAIRYISANLKRDKDVVLHAIESTGNKPFCWETEAIVWEQLEASVDEEVASRMRSWCEQRYGAEVAGSMGFQEIHAQYVSFPDGTAEDRKIFQDLGWFFLQSLDSDETAEMYYEESKT